MTVQFKDLIRVIFNLVFAVAQPLLSAAVFFRGFKTSPVPFPQALPTPIQPAGYAFSIWSVIYFGACAYAIYQALPQNHDVPIFRKIGWYTAGTMGLCCLWLLCARFGPVYFTVPVIVLMLVFLLFALPPVAALQPYGVMYWLVVAPLGLYARWLSVATFANVQEIMAAYGVRPIADKPVLWSILLILAATLVALIGSWATNANPFYVFAVVWALAAIAIINATNEVTYAVAAIAGGATFILAAFVAWLRLVRSGKSQAGTFSRM